MKKNRLINLFCIFIFANLIVWIFLVPLWHFPDEQAHFGQVAHIAETGRDVGDDSDKNITREIYSSEVFLGTLRDNLGNNKFTFHPEYKIPYSQSLEGIYEASIGAVAKNGDRKEFVIDEASKYPPLYYIPAAIIYNLFYNSDLFVRVYIARFWSLFLFSLNIYFVYLIAKLLFEKNKLIQLTLTLLVAFQPMMVFANSGVNSDALGNLLFTVFLYYCSRIIVRGLKPISIILLGLTVILCIYSKPQFILSLPLALLLIVFIVFRDTKGKYKIPSLFTLIVLSVIALFSVNFFRIGPISLFHQFLSRLDFYSLIKFTREYTISHTYREVLPWYFGIYDWLGVTYPRIIHRMINWTILLSIIGLVKYVFLAFRDRKLRNRNFQAGIFLVFVSAVYFIAICFYDWFSWYTQGYQLGVQGRYFFPVIIVHMLLLLIGWREIFPLRFKTSALKLLGVMMVILNVYALFTISKTYYDISTFDKFIIQVSQYKPWFVKSWGFIIVGAFFSSTLMAFLIEYIKYPNDQKKADNK